MRAASKLQLSFPRSAQNNDIMAMKTGQQVLLDLVISQNGYRKVKVLKKNGHGPSVYLPDYKLQEIVEVVNVSFPQPFLAEVDKTSNQ